MKSNNDNNKELNQKNIEMFTTEFVTRDDSSPLTFAKGWKFAVHECFKSALDFKFTKKNINNGNDGVWTQGGNYNFSVGDLIYDTHTVYWHKGKGPVDLFTWDIASIDLKYALQVIEAYPAKARIFKISNTTNNTGRNIEVEPSNDGYVRFKLLKKEKDSCRLENINVYSCTQVEFVRLLRNGKFTSLEGKEGTIELL